MESPHIPRLREEKETLFIALSAKALDFRSRKSLLNDQFADELVKEIGVNIEKYKGFGSAVIVVRAKQFDEWTKEFIAKHERSTIVYLGCGLDTRITRINPPESVDWFDIDYPEVIELRKKFFSQDDNYTMIPASITSHDWLESIPFHKPVLVIAEGVFEYLTAADVHIVLQRLTDYFPKGQIIFDVMSSFAIESGREKLKATTGAVHWWAVDNVEEVDRLNPAMKRSDDVLLLNSPWVRKLPLGLRYFVGLMRLFSKFKSMMRLLRYNFQR